MFHWEEAVGRQRLATLGPPSRSWSVLLGRGVSGFLFEAYCLRNQTIANLRGLDQGGAGELTSLKK